MTAMANASSCAVQLWTVNIDQNRLAKLCVAKLSDRG